MYFHGLYLHVNINSYIFNRFKLNYIFFMLHRPSLMLCIEEMVLHDSESLELFYGAMNH